MPCSSQPPLVGCQIHAAPAAVSSPSAFRLRVAVGTLVSPRAGFPGARWRPGSAPTGCRQALAPEPAHGRPGVTCNGFAQSEPPRLPAHLVAPVSGVSDPTLALNPHPCQRRLGQEARAAPPGHGEDRRPLIRRVDTTKSLHPGRDTGTWGAEREGFEPSVRFHAHTLSRRAPSATRTSLRIGCRRRRRRGSGGGLAARGRWVALSQSGRRSSRADAPPRGGCGRRAVFSGRRSRARP